MFERVGRDYVADPPFVGRGTHAFVWIDVEEYDEWLDEVDLETFPTLFILDRDSGAGYFYGAVLPQEAVLRRLVMDSQDNSCESRVKDPVLIRLGQHLLALVGKRGYLGSAT